MDRLTRFFARLFAAHQWLAVVYMVIVAGVLLWVAGHAASAASAWVVFIVAGLLGLVTAIVHTGILIKRGQLFLRDAEAIAQNRSRIQRVSIPLGYLTAGALLVVYAIGSPRLQAAVVSFVAGLLLGYAPSAFANFSRLRSEGRP